MSKGNGKANGQDELTDEELDDLVRETKRCMRIVKELERDKEPGTYDTIQKFRAKAQRAALKVVLSL